MFLIIQNGILHNVYVAFVRRSGNIVTDSLAQYTSSFLGFVWIEEVSAKIVLLVTADVLTFMSSTI